MGFEVTTSDIKALVKNEEQPVQIRNTEGDILQLDPIDEELFDIQEIQAIVWNDIPTIVIVIDY